MCKQDVASRSYIRRASVSAVLHTDNGPASCQKRKALLQFKKSGQRAADILAATALIILTLPLLMLAALAIKLESSGSIFVGTPYLGVFGEPFLCWSLRTEEAADGVPGASGHVIIGHIIWLTRISQIPVLFSVVLGDMTLLGPCPEPLLRSMQTLPTTGKGHRRTTAKPGLSGWLKGLEATE